jgi:hypothetical protein
MFSSDSIKKVYFLGGNLIEKRLEWPQFTSDKGRIGKCRYFNLVQTLCQTKRFNPTRQRVKTLRLLQTLPQKRRKTLSQPKRRKITQKLQLPLRRKTTPPPPRFQL